MTNQLDYPQLIIDGDEKGAVVRYWQDRENECWTFETDDEEKICVPFGDVKTFTSADGLEITRQLTGWLIDVHHETAEVVTIPHTLKAIYAALDCSYVEVAQRQIGVGRSRHVYDIICDEEGLFRDPQKISAIDNFGQPQLVGNLFIVNSTEDGEWTSLTKADVEYIRKYVLLQGTRNFPKPYYMLHQCEYA